MNAAQIFKEVRKKIGVSTPRLSEMLGYKSKAVIWLIERGYRKPSILMCRRLIKVAHDAGVELTMDELLGSSDESRPD
jgi:transcriptional regulator with XRE-family HTH domain